MSNEVCATCVFCFKSKNAEGNPQFYCKKLEGDVSQFDSCDNYKEQRYFGLPED